MHDVALSLSLREKRKGGLASSANIRPGLTTAEPELRTQRCLQLLAHPITSTTSKPAHPQAVIGMLNSFRLFQQREITNKSEHWQTSTLGHAR